MTRTRRTLHWAVAAIMATAATASVMTTPAASGAAAKNPSCLSKAEFKKLRMTAKPWRSGSTLREARRTIGSLGTAVVRPNYDDRQLNGYDDNVGLYFYTSIYAFGTTPEYQYGWAPDTPTCQPWAEGSSAVLVFRQYERHGRLGPWRLIGPRAPVPDSGFRGSTFAHWERA